ncbi:hypothetical protein [Aureibaculum luteum]|uniref:hypothetical protein n=1 Tax=Aureibaculum luteum TaxID=1548456 RepID=UPI000E4742D9|nr:hypothetical protein [Aureibaculum luteum]
MIIKHTPIFSLLLLVVFIAGTKEKRYLKASALQQNKIEAQLYKIDTIEVNIDSIIDISGEYELIKGRSSMIDSDDYVIYKGAMVIEKLSETDFGFYYANKIKELTPTGHFGIIRNFKNEFHTLRICNEKEVEGYSNENFVKGVYLNNQILIEKKGDLLTFIHYGSNFRSYALYKKKKPEADFYISVLKTLKKNKQFYDKFLLEYKEAVNYDKSKLEIEFVFKRGLWMSKHKHNVVDGILSYTHTYSKPSENEGFVKQDSIFNNALINYKK